MPHIPFDPNKKLPSKKEFIKKSKQVHEESIRYLELSKKARSIPPSRDFRCKRGRR
jgi:hypothetical protein